MYALCNNVKDLPVIFDGSDVVSVNRDNHYHNDVHLKKRTQEIKIFRGYLSLCRRLYEGFKTLTVQKTAQNQGPL